MTVLAQVLGAIMGLSLGFGLVALIAWGWLTRREERSLRATLLKTWLILFAVAAVDFGVAVIVSSGVLS